MIDTAALKNNILELAFKGELVSFVEGDGCISDLIQDIPSPSNKRLGLLKKGSDTVFPHTLPDNWEIVPLGKITSYGDTPTKIMASDVESDTWILELEDIEAGGRLLKKSRVGSRQAIGEKTTFNRGQVLYSKLRPYLKKVLQADEDGICTPELIAFDVYAGINPRYIMYYLICNFVDKVINQRSYGVKMPRVDAQFMVNLPVPLPTIAVQNKIVDIIDESFSKIEIINELQANYSSDLEAMKAKIIDAGIQGKLTKQLPEDGTAEELLEQIAEEKKALEDAGVYKNRKKVNIKDSIQENEIFEIPTNWKWVRLGQLADVYGRIGFRGYTKADLVEAGEGAISMSPSNITFSGEIVFENNTYITWEKYDESPEIMVNEGDVLIVKTGSSFGKTGIIEEMPEKCTINPQLAILKNILCDRYYLNLYLKSSHAWSQFNSFVVGAATPTFSQEKLANMLIPLPPIEEQRRIVEQMNDILAVM